MNRRECTRMLLGSALASSVGNAPNVLLAARGERDMSRGPEGVEHGAGSAGGPTSARSYYRHIVFDNSLTPGRYYFSEGRASDPSWLRLDKGKLPVETEVFFTPPNALRLQWRSAPRGTWETAVFVERWRNREIDFDGDTLYFWCYSPQGIPAAHLPRIQLDDIQGGFTAALSLERSTTGVPSAGWVQIKIPLNLFSTASLYPFAPSKLQSVSFIQGAADGADHTLIVDDIKLGTASRGVEGRPEPPQGLVAKGYDRHIDLSWRPVSDPTVERYVIHRSLDGVQYHPVGIQNPRFSRYADFLGEQNQKRFYRITTSDQNYRASAFSEAVSAATHALDDQELLTMIQEANFRYYWEGAHPVAGMALENIPGNEDMVATGASGFGIMALLAGVERAFIAREKGIGRLLRIAGFLETADRFHGAWPHFMDGHTGKALPVFGKHDNGADIVETAFLMQGLLAARQYFKRDGEAGRRLYARITGLWETVQWDWSPDYAWSNHKLIGLNETMIVYLLAIASPTHPVPSSVYYAGWASQSNEAAQYRRGWGGTADGDHYTN